MPSASNTVQIRPVVGKPRTAKYRSHFGYYVGGYHPALQRGIFTLADVPAMLRDPTIRICRKVVAAPISTARWITMCPIPEVQMFVDSQIKRLLRTNLDHFMTHLDFGYCGGEPVYFYNALGQIECSKIKGFAPWDIRPLQSDGELVGMSVRLNGYSVDADSPTENNKVYLFRPKYFWLVNEPEFNSLMGRSRLQGAWEPWMEKRGKHGAVDIRRLWFMKGAMNAGVIRHPLGTIQTETGELDARDYARQVVEWAESGGVVTLPSGVDPETGKYQWEWTPGTVNGGGGEFLNYARDLDNEMILGYEVMPEVIKASETGSGWSGRSVPFMTFLSGEDRIFSNILFSLMPILQFMVQYNFGQVPFDIEPISLMEMASNEGEPEATLGTEQKDLVRTPSKKKKK